MEKASQHDMRSVERKQSNTPPKEAGRQLSAVALKEPDRLLYTGFRRRNFVGPMSEPSHLALRIVSRLPLYCLPQ
jgi:hypothetical protein